MWNNIGTIGNFTKILAEKAAAAAENIEGQLNESVGAPPEFQREASKRLENNASSAHSFSPIVETAVSDDDDDDPFNENDGFYQEESFDVDMHDKTETEADQQQKNEVEASTENAESVNSVVVHDMTSHPITKEEYVHEVNDGTIEKVIDLVHTSPLNLSNVSAENDLDERKHSEELENKEVDISAAEAYPARNSNDTTENNGDIADENNQLNKGINGVADDPETMILTGESIKNQKETDSLPSPQLDIASQREHSILETEQQQDSEDKTLSHEDSGGFFTKDPHGHTEPTLEMLEREDTGLDALDTNMQGVSESDSEESIYVTKEEAMSMNPQRVDEKSLQSQLNELKLQLLQREEQLASKSTQLSEIMDLHEKEKSFLEAKLKETKEEAKKRISKAREKVDDMKAKLADVNNRASSIGSASNEQEKIIHALRQEGEELAKKQSEMEKLVRDARGDMRDLKNELEAEKAAKEKAEDNVANLEQELKDTKSELALAKQKLALTDKLESDLLAVREEKEKKSSIILGLEAKLKNTLLSNNQLQKEMDLALKDKVAELEKETSSIRNEKDAILQDLESKLRLSEREASLREDSLRHEVSELRKRWQEAVRRCDGELSLLFLLLLSVFLWFG